jgi:hypothetical protein
MKLFGRWPPQFSLWSILLLVSFLALGLAHLNASRELVRLKEENRRLRDDAGWPVVTEPQQIAAGVVAFWELETWRFRVYQPPGRTLVLRCATDDTTGDIRRGAQTFHQQSPGRDREWCIELSIRRNNAHAYLNVNTGLALGVFSIPEDHWLHRETPFIFHTDGNARHAAIDAVDGYVLLRIVPRPISHADQLAVESSSGKDLLVWLEDAPDKQSGEAP